MEEEKIITIEPNEGEEIEITKFPEQTTFNTEDMSIVEESE